MTARLWLIRHGQTDWNREGRYQGQADPPLNAAGLAQAQRLAARLGDRAYAALYTSDLTRARQTAAVLALGSRLPLRPEPRLREVNHGIWDGLLLSEIQARFADSWAELRREPDVARPPGGETVVEVAARVSAALDDIADRHPGTDVLVVSHGLAIATALCQAQGLPLRRAHDLVPPNAEAVVLAWKPG
jgi:broad specificity phosphatase PhoE